jgi:hypothetical protein
MEFGLLAMATMKTWHGWLATTVFTHSSICTSGVKRCRNEHQKMWQVIVTKNHETKHILAKMTHGYGMVVTLGHE